MSDFLRCKCGSSYFKGESCKRCNPPVLSDEQLLRQKIWAEFESYIHPDTVLVAGKKLSVCHKFNITREELEKALRYAESSSCDCVTISASGGNVGSSIYVSSGWESVAMDISDYSKL